MSFLQGFKLFFLIENELSAISLQNGMAELSRLEQGHYLIIAENQHNLAFRLVSNGQSFFPRWRVHLSTIGMLQKTLAVLDEQSDACIITLIPKRWFKKTQARTNLLAYFEENILSASHGQIPNNYIWGIYTIWDPNFDKYGEGKFYRNPGFHANDSLLNLSQKIQKPNFSSAPKGMNGSSFHAFDF